MCCNPANGRVNFEERSAYKIQLHGIDEIEACQPTETKVQHTKKKKKKENDRQSDKETERLRNKNKLKHVILIESGKS